eukprot:TRINITY_DN904_c1_g1_i1.p1 TRINITY_DN904_c1_g1~~TRINITY_DN904_c1_g1_i1.p1  ORF type:complete len:813 (+),score=267.93 TRINITY_DN904_c1_g1_i1:1057-3495(+)
MQCIRILCYRNMSISPRSSTSPRLQAPKTCSSVVKRGEGCDIRSMISSRSDVWTADRDGNLTIRDAATGDVRNRTRCSDAVVWCLAEVGSSVWAGLSNGYIEIFNSTTYEVMDEIQPVASINNTCGAHCIHACYDSVFVGYGHAGIIRWDANTRQVIRQYRGHADVVRCLKVRGDKLYSGSNDSTIAVWDIVGEQQVDEWRHESGAVLVLETTSTHLWSGGEDSLIRVWDPDRSVCVRILDLHSGAVGSILFTGDRVWCGSWDGTLSLWNPKSLRLLERLDASHDANVMSLIQVKKTLVTQVWVSSSDKVIRKWDSETAEALKDKILERQLEESREQCFHTTEENHSLKGEVARLQEKLRGYDTLKLEREMYKEAAEEALILLGGDEDDVPDVREIQKLIKAEAQLLQDHVADLTSERDQYAEQVGQIKSWAERAKRELQLETEARKQWQREAASLQEKLRKQNEDNKRLKLRFLTRTTHNGVMRRVYGVWSRWLQQRKAIRKFLAGMSGANDRALRRIYYRRLYMHFQNRKTKRSAMLLCGGQRGLAGMLGGLPVDLETARQQAAVLMCRVIMSTTTHGRMASAFRNLKEYVLLMKKAKQRLAAADVLIRGSNTALIRVYLSKLYLHTRMAQKGKVRAARMRAVMKDTVFASRRRCFNLWLKWYQDIALARRMGVIKGTLCSGLQKQNECLEMARCFNAFSKYVMWKQHKRNLTALRAEYRLKSPDGKRQVDIHDSLELRGFIISTREQMLRKIFSQYDLLMKVFPPNSWAKPSISDTMMTLEDLRVVNTWIVKNLVTTSEKLSLGYSVTI